VKRAMLAPVVTGQCDVTGEQPAVFPVGDEGLVVVGETPALDVVSEGEEAGAEGQQGVPGQAGVDLRGAVLVRKPPGGVGGEDSDFLPGRDESQRSDFCLDYDDSNQINISQSSQQHNEAI